MPFPRSASARSKASAAFARRDTPPNGEPAVNADWYSFWKPRPLEVVSPRTRGTPSWQDSQGDDSLTDYTSAAVVEEAAEGVTRLL